jgi:PKD repeat protein
MKNFLLKKYFTSVAFIMAITIGTNYAQIPILNSLPSSPYVIFLDFDGHTVSGTSWNAVYNSGNPIVCAPSGYDDAKINTVFNYTANDFGVFNINVTTDSVVFNNAPLLQKVRVVITPTQGWFPYSAGGVAYFYSFTSPTNNVCFGFTGSLAYDGGYTGELCSHEVGHTLGLSHHSEYNSSCAKIAEYLGGAGSGETGWAPIMGVGYYKNMTTWSNLAYNSGCTNAQSDLEIIVAPFNNGVAYKTDEHGNDNTTTSNLNITTGNFSDSGIITNTNDVDVFKINVSTKSFININALPKSFGANNTKANLDILLLLKDAAGNTIDTKNPVTTLDATMSNVLLNPGNYFIYIDGSTNPNQNGYGSIGQFFITGSVIPVVSTTVTANFIASNTSICKNGSINFTDQSIGNNTSWNWTFAGGTPSTFNGKTPGLITYANPGTYAVSLTVSDGVSTNAKTTNSYIQVNGEPTISISPLNPFVCGSGNINLTATGALNYNWTPSPSLNNTVLDNVTVFNLTADATFQVIGTDINGCSASKSVLVKYNVPPVLIKSPIDNYIYTCKNDSTILNVSGASTYLWSPVTGLNNATSATVKFSLPNATNAYYTVKGTDVNGCYSFAYFNLINRACDSLSAEINTTIPAICLGDSVKFSDNSTGYPTKWEWSFPGGLPASSNLQNPGWVRYATSGEYNVILKSIKGLDTSTKTVVKLVTIANYPTLAITPAIATICSGDSLNLTAATAQAYYWSSNPSIVGSQYNATIKVKPTITTKYVVTADNYSFSQGGWFQYCSTKDSVIVTVGGTCAVLPLHVKFFTGTKIADNNILLQWEVDGQGVEKFEIEKSLDGINFNTVVQKNKNSNGLLYYQYVDQTISNKEIIYYRLKMIEQTGAVTYSDIVPVSNKKDVPFIVNIWNNPVKDALRVTLKSKLAGKVDITLNNTLGSLIFNKKIDISIGHNDFTENVSTLKKGIYFLNVYYNKEHFTYKIIKE